MIVLRFLSGLPVCKLSTPWARICGSSSFPIVCICVKCLDVDQASEWGELDISSRLEKRARHPLTHVQEAGKMKWVAVLSVAFLAVAGAVKQQRRARTLVKCRLLGLA